MSEDQEASGQADVVGDESVQKESTQGADGNQGKKEDKVAYETYKKVLAEAKKAKEEAKSLKESVDKYQQTELESKGKQAELIDSLRKQLAEKDKENADFKKNYAFKLLNKAIEAEGAKHGCLDNDLLLKSIDLNAIEFGDDFAINTDDLAREIGSVVNKKPFLFKKKGASVSDVNPTINKDALNGNKDLNKLPLAEKMAMLAKMSADGAFSKRKN